MEKLFQIIEEILDIKKGSIEEKSIIGEIEEWDSLANLQIIAEIEETFNVVIPIEEIKNIRRVKDLAEYIEGV